MGIFCSTPDPDSLSRVSTFEQMISTTSSLEPLVIWSDPNIKSTEYQDIVTQLNKFCKVSTLTEPQQATKLITESKRFCHVITDGENPAQFQTLHNLENVCSIYVFTQNSEWAENSHKTILVENDSQKFLQFLNCHLRYTSPFRLPISLKEVNQNNVNPIFLNQNLNPLLSAERFFQLARKVFSRNPAIDSLETFYRNPECDKLEILKIYAQETFLYKMVNNSLNMSLIPEGRNNPCEFIIKDLQKTIQEQYQSLPKSFSGVFYKTGIMPLNLPFNFQSYLNKDVEIKHFIIANKKKEQIFKFAKFSTISPQEIALLTLIVPQLPDNNSGGFVRLTQNELGKIDCGEEVLFNTCSKFKLLEVNYSENDELAYPHVALLYGFDIINQYLQEGNPEIIIERLNIFKKACSQGRQCKSESQDNFIYLDLCNPTKYFCQKCSESIKSCFLCVSPYLYQNLIPDVDKISTTRLNGMAVSYPSETAIPFYGYHCSGCNKVPAKLCFHCISDDKKWCEDCQKDKESCLIKGHEVVLETSPYSFWSTGSKDVRERIQLNQNQEEEKVGSAFASGLEAEQEARHYDAIKFFDNELMVPKNTHIRRISTFNHLALNSAALEHFGAAEGHLMGALEIIIDFYGPKHLKVAEALISLGQLDVSSGNSEKAEEKYNEAFEIKLFVETQKSRENTMLKNLLPIVFKFLKEYPKSSGKHGDILNLFKALTAVPKNEKPNFVNFLYALESAYKNNGNDVGAQECSQFMWKHVLKSDMPKN